MTDITTDTAVDQTARFSSPCATYADTNERTRVERDMIIALAGAIAENRAAQGRPDPERPEPTPLDLLLAMVDGQHDDATACQQWLSGRAERFVDFYWPEISAVARALVRHRLMSADAVKRVMREQSVVRLRAWDTSAA